MRREFLHNVTAYKPLTWYMRWRGVSTEAEVRNAPCDARKQAQVLLPALTLPPSLSPLAVLCRLDGSEVIVARPSAVNS